MWSLNTLEYLNRQAAKKARERGATPFVPDGPEAVDAMPPFPFPNLGYYDQPGWERTEQLWFVDKFGWDRPAELALTGKQFKERLKSYVMENPNHGFGIVEEGEFQVYISAFRPVQGHHENISQDL